MTVVDDSFVVPDNSLGPLRLDEEGLANAGISLRNQLVVSSVVLPDLDHIVSVKSRLVGYVG
jgi:hypothetical protein